MACFTKIKTKKNVHHHLLATPVFFLFLFSSFVEVKTPSVTRSGRRKTNEAGMSTMRYEGNHHNNPLQIK